MTLIETALAALPTTECVNWTGYLDPDGYAHNVNGQVARQIYGMVVGPVADDLTIDHLCRNHACVNPTHLEPVTTQENTRRGHPATKTACQNGHPYDAVNTYIRPNGRRDCRTCIRDRQRLMVKRRVPA